MTWEDTDTQRNRTEELSDAIIFRLFWFCKYFLRILWHDCRRSHIHMNSPIHMWGHTYSVFPLLSMKSCVCVCVWNVFSSFGFCCCISVQFGSVLLSGQMCETFLPSFRPWHPSVCNGQLQLKFSWFLHWAHNFYRFLCAAAAASSGCLWLWSPLQVP